MPDRVRVADEVRAALAAGRPVVALESTLISHGLPRPENLDVATRLEVAVRAGGAVPATIGIVAGRPTIGLDGEELELLARARDVRKCSRRDLAVAVANGEHGATTVAGSLVLMGLVGLPVLATGGTGGVHRRAEATFDISADLAELARTRALVVSAGAKALLDLPRTIEVLETLGVLVLGWRTDDFPAFYTPSSGLPVVARVSDAVQVARIARAAWDLDLGRGLLLAVPPPAASALAADEAEGALSGALDAAEAGGLRGPAVTPFLLDAVANATTGRSLRANVALLENNARVAAEVAVALAGTEDERKPEAEFL
jgi:pseudouridylate synthase